MLLPAFDVGAADLKTGPRAGIAHTSPAEPAEPASEPLGKHFNKKRVYMLSVI